MAQYESFFVRWSSRFRRRGRITRLLVLSAAIALVAGSAKPALALGPTSVAIEGTHFLINGSVTNPGTPLEGLLPNSRMIQAVWDDENPATVGNWSYPDTGRWDPQRNTDEFVAALPSYAASGLKCVTVGFQGGSPGWMNFPGGYGGNNQPNISSGFYTDGTLKSPWLARLNQVLTAAGDNGIVVIVSYFYFGQDQRLSSDAAVQAGVDALTDWLMGVGNPYRASPYPNVLVEIANEADNSYDLPSLQAANIPLLLDRVRQRSGGRLKVGNSLNGGSIPSDSLIRASDFVLLHGNGQTSTGVTNMVNQVKSSAAYQANPKPIVFNEDSTNLSNMDAARAGGASWGYYDQGLNDYLNGFQSPPVNWNIGTPAKTSFFDEVSQLSATPTTITYGLLVSSTSDRSAAVALSNDTVSGNIYVFLQPSDSISTVGFYLDDPAMSGAPTHVELIAPYDFAGGSVAAANPFDTSQLTDGTHTITAAITFIGGAQTVVNSTFASLNDASPVLTLSVTPPSQVLVKHEANYAISLSATNGYSGSTTMTVAGLPDRVSATFTPDTLAPGAISTLTVYALGGVAPGTYPLTITASEGTRSASAVAELVVLQ